MVTAETLAARRQEIAGSDDLSRLLERLTAGAHPVLDRMPAIPRAKALLSTDGGVCPDDGATLVFDPWSPISHHCPRCGRSVTGERHDRWWARFQHLWVAERAVHLAAIGVFGEHAAAATRACELLAAYGDIYFACPNRDNVLGPSRLFFSTYLESIWISSYLAAATLLREAGQLDDGTAKRVAQIADEAANLIGEFDEGFSNRQTWHNAALAAIAVWFEDEDLLRRAVEGPTGLLAHLAHGFGTDGMWFEGENYHLFALRGLLTGFSWVRAAGVDPYADPELTAQLDRALRAPTLTALPDFTFPARKDSRFGVSLAQPMYLELWEAGRGAQGGFEHWLAALYASPAPPAEVFDSYLHEAGAPPPVRRGREDLSWWMLLAMGPALHGSAERWRPESVLLEAQGLAVLRTGGRYASLECGAYGGGHGHPDRLHLTLHEAGTLWLPDPGTGSYASPDLFWYRSTLAHNAPRLDGVSQPVGDAVADSFDVRGEWGWTRGRYGDVSRTLVSGPDYLLDVVELASEESHAIELPWHFTGEASVEAPGSWEPAVLADPQVSSAERFLPEGRAPLVIRAPAEGGSKPLRATFLFDGELLRAVAPGVPGSGPARFYLARASGKAVRLVTALSTGELSLSLHAAGDTIEVRTAKGVHRHHGVVEGWEIEVGSAVVRLSGRRAEPRTIGPLTPQEPPLKESGVALRVAEPPALDGTLDGFDAREPLALDHDDQYRRSEEPYPGPDELSALAYVNWDDDTLYLAVDVTKPDPCFRPDGAPPLLLDNEPDDIHSDGLQVYVRLDPAGGVFGFLVVPSHRDQALRVRGASDTAGDPAMVEGAWSRTETGYLITLALRLPGWDAVAHGDEIDFDLLVNETLPGRERRAGQLVWSGGGGWVYLRGDRQPAERFGVVALA